MPQPSPWSSRAVSKDQRRKTASATTAPAGLTLDSRTRRHSIDSQHSSPGPSPPSVYDDSPEPIEPSGADLANSFDISRLHSQPVPALLPMSTDTPRTGDNQLDTFEVERQGLLKSLLSSEKNFLKSSRAVIRKYFLPLRARESRAWLPGLPPTIARFFDWFEDIVNVHAILARALAFDPSALVRALRAFVAQLEVYVPYFVKLDSVLEALRWHAANDAGAFGEYLRMKHDVWDRERKGDEWTLERIVEEPVARLRALLGLLQVQQHSVDNANLADGMWRRDCAS